MPPWEKYQAPAAAPTRADGPWAKYGAASTARQQAEALLSPTRQRLAADDAAIKAGNEQAPWYEQLFTGAKTQTGRTALGVLELANKVTGGRYIDPDVLAEAQRQADREDAGTGVAGAVGNVAGDFRNFLPIGAAGQAVKAKTLGQAVKQSAKVGAAAGAVSGLTEGTQDADSTILSNLKNAAIGAGTGAAIGATLPGVATGAKKTASVVGNAADRALAFAGSDAAAGRVAYGNVAKLLKGQGYTPGEVASILDEFQAQGIDGGTLGQILQSSDLLAREKNLLQGGGEAGRLMGESLKDQPRRIAQSIIAKAKEYAQPEQTDYLYKQAAGLADQPTSTAGADGVASMGKSATQQEIPFTLNAIEQDLADRADELPATVAKRIMKIITQARTDGGFEAADKAKQQLDDLFKENSTTTDQDLINEAVSGYRKMLNDSLDQAGGDTYRAAKQSALRDMAMREVQEAVTGANGLSVKAALNKFFGSLEKQEEFFRKLPDAAKAEWQTFLDNLEKVSGRFGGSDTASNTATQKAMAAETGIGFDPNLNPLTVLDRVTAPLQRRVRTAQAELSLAPDAERLAQAMRKGEFSYSAPAAVPRVLSSEAAKAEADAQQLAAKPVPAASPQRPAAPVEAAQPTRSPLVQRMAAAESGGDPNAKNPNGTASGLLGFTDDTWARAVAKWGKELGITLKDKGNGDAQLAMGEKLAADNARILTKQIGREPTDGEVYAAHFLGAPDATKLIKAQGTGKQAILLFPRRVVNDNRAVFFDGKRPRSVEEVMNVLNNKVA